MSKPETHRNKRVSFKTQASGGAEMAKTEKANRDQKIGSVGAAAAAEGNRSTTTTNPLRPSVSMASISKHLEHNGRSSQAFPGRVDANVELTMASLPANHPDRVVPPSRIPRTFPSTMLPNYHKLKIPTNPLVFGGSFPIDDPISPRQLGSGHREASRVSLNTPRTYQVDTICCQAPNLCDEHARLGRDTDIARAEARLQATQSDDSDDDESSRPSSCPPVSQSNSPPAIDSVAAEDIPSTESHPSSPSHHHHEKCSCSPDRTSVPYRSVFTYPVDHSVEDGLIPMLTDDDFDYHYDYQDEEEYDDFGGDVYEDYEESEELGIREPDYEADYQLRHRHPTQLVSSEEPHGITSTIPKSVVHQPPLPPSPSPHPTEATRDDEKNVPMFMGFSTPSPSPTAAATSANIPSNMEHSAYSNNPSPMFQPLPQHSPFLSSPLPPPLGLNSHVTQVLMGPVHVLFYVLFIPCCVLCRLYRLLLFSCVILLA